MPLNSETDEVIHGVKVRDPFRWLEDRTLPETAVWIEEQQRRCRAYFSATAGLQFLEDRVRDSLDVDYFDQPASIGGTSFYRRRARGQEQASICVYNTTTAIERVLVDPSGAGPYASVSIYRISADGAIVAFELRRGGEDRAEIRFVRAGDGSLLPNLVPFGYKRGLAFAGRGYIYCHETELANKEHAIFHQFFGSDSPPTPVLRVPRLPGSRLTLIASQHLLGAFWAHPESGKLLTDFWIAEIADVPIRWSEVFRNRHPLYHPILCHNRILVLAETAQKSSQLFELSSDGEVKQALVPEKPVPIRQIAITKDRLFLGYLEEGATTIDALSLNGESIQSHKFGSEGTLRFLPVPSQECERFFYSWETFDFPPAIYECGFPLNPILWNPTGPTRANRARTQVWEAVYPSRDGAMIPISLVAAPTEQERKQPRPTVMTCYGGFGVPMTPQYSVFAAILLELGVVLALPHLRGGGELGEAWHQAGCRRNRQTGIDDFLAAAEWLRESGVSEPERLGIIGGSNAGLVIAAALTQQPRMFQAVVCIAPLLDMIRYERFDQAVKWIPEYGTVEDEADFRALIRYSPYHHIAEEINYPPTLFVSGDLDDRCNPAHVRKMAAQMASRAAQKSPIVVDYSEERGHSPALPLSIRIESLSRRLAFLCRELGITLPAGGRNETNLR